MKGSFPKIYFFFKMKRIKYEFYKTTKVKDKINKIWM